MPGPGRPQAWGVTRKLRVRALTAWAREPGRVQVRGTPGPQRTLLPLREVPLPVRGRPRSLPLRGRGPPFRSGLLLFRRISDCLSPLKVFRLEGNTHVLHPGWNGRASYFRENESIVTGCTGAPSVSLLPGVIPAAAMLDTTSSPDVTRPTTV